MLFTWNMEEDNTWTPGAALSTSPWRRLPMTG